MGHTGAGDRLLDMMQADDEQTRTLAGMALVQAGERSVGLIESALDKGTAPAQAVRLLADIGGDHARSVLDAAASRKDAIAESAAEALDLLDRIEELDDPEGRTDGKSL